MLPSSYGDISGVVLYHTEENVLWNGLLLKLSVCKPQLIAYNQVLLEEMLTYSQSVIFHVFSSLGVCR